MNRAIYLILKDPWHSTKLQESIPKDITLSVQGTSEHCMVVLTSLNTMIWPSESSTAESV